MNTSTTTPTPAGTAGPSTERPAAPRTPAVGAPQAGDLVLVRLDAGTVRPMQVTSAGYVPVGALHSPNQERRVSGVIFCEPDDHSLPAFRMLGTTGDPARIHGRPERLLPIAYGEHLKAGTGIAEWTMREGQ